MSSKSDFFKNLLTDLLWRGQSMTLGPSGGAFTLSWSGATPTFYIGLVTTPSNDSGPGIEVSGGSYARQSFVADLNNMSGTQGVGSTSVSDGTGGVSSNNVAFTFNGMPDCTTTGVSGFAVFDSATGGNMLEYGTINGGTPVYVEAGGSVIFSPASLTLQEG